MAWCGSCRRRHWQLTSCYLSVAAVRLLKGPRLLGKKTTTLRHWPASLEGRPCLYDGKCLFRGSPPCSPCTPPPLSEVAISLLETCRGPQVQSSSSTDDVCSNHECLFVQDEIISKFSASSHCLWDMFLFVFFCRISYSFLRGYICLFFGQIFRLFWHIWNKHEINWNMSHRVSWSVEIWNDFLSYCHCYCTLLYCTLQCFRITVTVN